jgi:hypothetical protein
MTGTGQALHLLHRQPGIAPISPAKTGKTGIMSVLYPQRIRGRHDEHGGDVRASQNGPAAITSVTTLPGRRPEAPTSAIVSSAARFCCKLE